MKPYEFPTAPDPALLFGCGRFGRFGLRLSGRGLLDGGFLCGRFGFGLHGGLRLGDRRFALSHGLLYGLFNDGGLDGFKYV